LIPAAVSNSLLSNSTLPENPHRDLILTRFLTQSYLYLLHSLLIFLVHCLIRSNLKMNQEATIQPPDEPKMLSIPKLPDEIVIKIIKALLRNAQINLTSPRTAELSLKDPHRPKILTITAVSHEFRQIAFPSLKDATYYTTELVAGDYETYWRGLPIFANVVI
jgi:hypothetical protein